jgi:hypothetical protein
MLILQEFDINPRVTLMGKITLATSLCVWISNELVFKQFGAISH